MDMTQLEKLLEVLNLSSKNRALDLGCGIGTLTEYISDITGAHIIGVDLVTELIIRAIERTREKKDRLEFLEGDMNDLSFPPAIADTIIIIDSLQHVSDLMRVVGQMKSFLKPQGQMGIFYSEHFSLHKLKLAEVLKKHNLSFQTFDYSKKEHEIWRNRKLTLEELKEEFRVEGNLQAWKFLNRQCKMLLKVLDAGKGERYLYHVQRY